MPILPGDDAQALAARVLVAEHKLYPAGLGRGRIGKKRTVRRRPDGL